MSSEDVGMKKFDKKIKDGKFLGENETEMDLCNFLRKFEKSRNLKV